MNWEGVRCLVTGGAGFIGSALVQALVMKGATVTVVDDLSRGSLENLASVRHKTKFLRHDLSDASAALESVRHMDFCFHLANVVGGVGFMTSHPAMMFKNIAIDHNILEACRNSSVRNTLYVSSACVYPVGLQHSASQPPLKEEVAFQGGSYPDGAYGWIKLIGELQCKAYHDEYGTKIAIVRPFNPYGPQESFSESDSHFIPALIRRVFLRENPISLWGNGSQERDFVYVSDVLDGMTLAIERIEDATPVNLGCGKAVQISALAQLVLEIIGYETDISWDTSKPMGVVSRKADVSRVIRLLNWAPKVSLREGLIQMINAYAKGRTTNEGNQSRH